MESRCYTWQSRWLGWVDWGQWDYDWQWLDRCPDESLPAAAAERCLLMSQTDTWQPVEQPVQSSQSLTTHRPTTTNVVAASRDPSHASRTVTRKLQSSSSELPAGLYKDPGNTDSKNISVWRRLSPDHVTGSSNSPRLVMTSCLSTSGVRYFENAALYNKRCY